MRQGMAVADGDSCVREGQDQFARSGEVWRHDAEEFLENGTHPQAGVLQRDTSFRSDLV
jgi:hypothetical protein